MKSKHLGQVFTPSWIVNKILKSVGYEGEKVLSSKIIDNSAGDGAFIVNIIKRIIEFGKKEGLNNREIMNYIKKNVYAIELDKDAYESLLMNVKELILFELNLKIKESQLNFHNNNTFLIADKFKKQFDFVVGNPPYIRVHNIDLNTREILKNMEFSKNGMTDVYIGFFEMGIDMLNNNGTLGYISPSSYFNSRSGEVFKDFILKNMMIKEIVDFKHKKIFNNITTYPAITILTKQKNSEILWEDFGEKTKTLSFSDEIFPIKYSKRKEDKILVKNGFATLNDNFFISDEKMCKDSIPVLKASNFKWKYAFFPYDENGNPKSFKELDNSSKKYTSLNKKDTEYLFGRTQALKDVQNYKYCISTLVKEDKEIRIVESPSGSGVYSGLYILNATEKDLEKINSQKFIKFIKSLRRYKNGGYYTYNSSELQWFLNHC